MGFVGVLWARNGKIIIIKNEESEKPFAYISFCKGDMKSLTSVYSNSEVKGSIKNF